MIEKEIFKIYADRERIEEKIDKEGSQNRERGNGNERKREGEGGRKR